jgi:hypothetical protein
MTVTVPTVPAPGDESYLASYLVGTYLFGSVIPPDTVSPFSGTYEIYGDIGSMVFPAIQGPQGPPGPAAFALHLVPDATVDTPAELPQTLTNTVADIGKFWLLDDVAASGAIIGASAYVWYGTAWRRVMLGTPGPPGPCPIITPTCDVVPPDQNSTIETGGTPLEPTWHMDLAVPLGPGGPAAAMATCPDVDLITNPPQPGDVLGHTGRFTQQHLGPPGGLQAVYSPTGGALPANTYEYIMTTTTPSGESTPGAPVSVQTGGTTSSVEVVWDPVPAAGGYKIYRTTTPGTYNTLVATITSGATQSFKDTGGATTTAVPPNVNAAAVLFPLWVPVNISQLLPSPYSMPENAFTSYTGISARAGIGSFAIPPQPFPWTPIVWGHIGVFGIELSLNPLTIGCEVLIGEPAAGQLVARGFGNTLGEVNIMPHYSTPSRPGVALTPTNGLAVVPANHSSTAEGTIYVNLWNDGAIGLYLFNPTDAQIYVQVTPVSEPTALAAPAIAGATRRRLPARAAGRRR